jgi:protein arginine kinase activator
MFVKICPDCGTRLDDFYNTGMLGCPTCYKAFNAEIKLALKKIQGRDFHAGKTLGGTKLDKELLDEFKRLLKEKEDATINGRFPEIKRLTEEILELKEELKRRGII